MDELWIENVWILHVAWRLCEGLKALYRAIERRCIRLVLLL